MRLLPWQPCSKLKQQIGRRPRKRCHSWCRAHAGSPVYVVERYLMNLFLSSVLSINSALKISAVRVHTNSRGGAGGRGRFHSHQPERPLPTSYVCYRCGQKGLHFSMRLFSAWTNAFSKDIGYRIVPRTTIASTTIGHASSGRLVSLGVS